jgi:hypothetical protein
MDRDSKSLEINATESMLVWAIPLSVVASLVATFFEPRLIPLLLFGGPCVAFALRPPGGSAWIRSLALAVAVLLVLATLAAFLVG